MKLRNLTTASIFAIATTYTNQDAHALQYPYLFVCQSCAAGTYSDGTLEKCKECPAGQYSTGNASSCSTCNAGTYSNKGANQTGSTGCNICSAGTYSGRGASSCSSCSSTKYEAWGGNCGTVTRNVTKYCTKAGSTSPTGNSETTTESKAMSCSGHNYCSASINGTCISCSKPSNSSWDSTSGCGWSCNAGYYKSSASSCTNCLTAGVETCDSITGRVTSCKAGHYKSGDSCKLSLYAYKRSVGGCVGNSTYSSVVTYKYIGEANDGFSKTLNTEWFSSGDYHSITYDFSTNNLGNLSVTVSCGQYDSLPRNYDPSVHNGGLNFVDTDSYFYKSKSGGVDTYTTFTRK